MEKISMYETIKEFNRSEMKMRMIPQGLATGWPALSRVGKTLCVTLPYYSSIKSDDKVYLNPIYCSVTFPVRNPDRILDFTIYPHQKSWSDVDYNKPAGIFKHEALSDVKTKGEYIELRNKLFEYYDEMIAAIVEKRSFDKQDEMRELFSKLMEPGLYPQYLKINSKFYSNLCEI